MNRKEIRQYKNITAGIKEIQKALNTDSGGDRKQLEKKKRELLKDKQLIDEWVERIDDAVLYTIFHLKAREHRTDEYIAETLGYSRPAITRMINNYLHTH